MSEPVTLDGIIASVEAGNFTLAGALTAEMLGDPLVLKTVRRRVIPVLRKQRAWIPLVSVLRAHLGAGVCQASEMVVLASALSHLKDPDGADAVLREAGERFPDDLMILRARLQHGLRFRSDEHAAAIAGEVADWSRCDERLVELGMVAFLRNGEPARAYAVFTSFAGEWSPGIASAAVQAQLDLGCPQAAARVGQRALREGKDSAALRFALGHAWRDDFDYRRAIQHFEEGLKLRPDDVSLLAALGELYLIQARPKAAQGLLEKAVAAAPHLVHVRALHARALKDSRRFAEAAVEWLAVVRRDGDNPHSLRHAASALSQAGRTSEAAGLYKRLTSARARTLPADFEAGLADIDLQIDDVHLPRARLDWAWNLKGVSDIDRLAWERRAKWGYLADRLIFDWLECRPAQAEEAMYRLADLEAATEELSGLASAGGLIIASAHIGPMFASPLALELMDFRSKWLASTPSVHTAYANSLISTSDQTDAQVVRQAMSALDSGAVVALAVDGAINMAAPRIQFEGQEITFSSFAARLAYRRRVNSAFAAPMWIDGGLSFHVRRLPAVDEVDDIETFSERWREAYLHELRVFLKGQPENLRLSGGIWRHVRHRRDRNLGT